MVWWKSQFRLVHPRTPFCSTLSRIFFCLDKLNSDSWAHILLSVCDSSVCKRLSHRCLTVIACCNQDHASSTRATMYRPTAITKGQLALIQSACSLSVSATNKRRWPTDVVSSNNVHTDDLCKLSNGLCFPSQSHNLVLAKVSRDSEPAAPVFSNCYFTPLRRLLLLLAVFICNCAPYSRERLTEREERVGVMPLEMGSVMP